MEAKDNAIDTIREKERKNTLIMLWFLVGVGVALIGVLIVVLVMSVLRSRDVVEAVIEEEVAPEVIVIDEETNVNSGSVAIDNDGEAKEFFGKYVIDNVTVELTDGLYENSEEGKSVFVVANGGKLVLSNAKINENVANVPAVVVLSGGEVVFKDVDITTTLSEANGIDMLGGVLSAEGLSVVTFGQKSIGVNAENGSEVVLLNSELHTGGEGAPMLYVEGAVTLEKVSGTAMAGQVAVVEGASTINMSECNFAANGNGLFGDESIGLFYIYRKNERGSMEDMAHIVISSSTLNVNVNNTYFEAVPVFNATNTFLDIALADDTISLYVEANFVQATGSDEWGAEGENGAYVHIEANNMNITNSIRSVDDISEVVWYYDEFDDGNQE